MTNIDIANGLVFQALGISKDTFDDRLLSQKKIFLLQELGVNLGYTYNWYVHGPYSPDLTTYIFNKLDVLKEEDFSDYRFSEAVQEKVETVNALAAKKPGALSMCSWYELLASVLYIKRKWKKEDVFASLVKHKPKFSEEQFEAAVQELRAVGCYA